MSKVTPTSAVLVIKADVATNVTVDNGAVPGVYTASATGANAVRHEIPLTGLPAASIVYYRVTIADASNPAINLTLPEQSFHTERAPGQTFSFAVAGDHRPATDTTVPPAVWGTIVGQMQGENLDLALDVGDIIYGLSTDTAAQNEARYDGLFAETASLTATVPLYVAAGNHEWLSVASNKAGFEREFALPVNNGADAATNGEMYYSFDDGDTHFIALSTELPGQEGLVTGNQFAWLQQDLAANARPWIVVFMHRPLFSGTHALDPWMNAANAAGQQNKAQLHALFRQSGVDVVFEGHDHYYLRHVEDGIQYVITGGGGAPLYNTPPLGPGDAFGAVAFEHVKAIAGPQSLKVSALDSAGNALETFTLGGPSLRLGLSRAYWASYPDFLGRDLSVDYSLANPGAGDALDVQIVSQAATNGVLPTTAVPVPLGTIASGAAAPTTLRYQVPNGVSSFYTTSHVTCSDRSGNAYTFPGPALVA